MKFTLTRLAAATALTFASTSAVAVAQSVTNTNFTMYDPTGAIVGVDNTVSAWTDWNAMTWGVASTTPFFGLQWTASGGTLFGPGTYTFSVNGDGANAPAGSELVTFTVGAGQIGGNINFAWGATTGIDVFNVWDFVYNGNGGYNLVSTDIDGAGIPGIGMVDGPFPGFSANFNLCLPNLEGGGCEISAPIPEASTYAMMLAGLGLVGAMARRRKQTRI